MQPKNKMAHFWNTCVTVAPTLDVSCGLSTCNKDYDDDDYNYWSLHRRILQSDIGVYRRWRKSILTCRYVTVAVRWSAVPTVTGKTCCMCMRRCDACVGIRLAELDDFHNYSGVIAKHCSDAAINIMVPTESAMRPVCHCSPRYSIAEMVRSSVCIRLE